MSSGRASFGLRAVLAVVLFFSFYVIALGVAGALLGVPLFHIFVIQRVAHTGLIKIDIICVVAGFAILIGLIPRRIKFTDPGARLSPQKQPRLFQAIEKAAGAAGEAVPQEVYLVVEKLKEAEVESLKHREADPYDSHPPLPERLAALEKLARPDEPRDSGEPAVSLLDELAQVELELLRVAMGLEKANMLQALPWDKASSKALVVGWEKSVAQGARALQGQTVASLGVRGKQVGVLARALVPPEARARVPAEDLTRVTISLVGSALSLALSRRGWSVKSDLGEPVLLQKDAVTLEPFKLMGELAEGKLSPGEWTRVWTDAGVIDLDLGKASDAVSRGVDSSS